MSQRPVMPRPGRRDAEAATVTSHSATPNPPTTDPSPASGGRSTRWSVLLGRAVIILLAAGLSGAVGVFLVVVGPNIEEYEGVLPKLDDRTVLNDPGPAADEVLGWDSQQRKKAQGAEVAAPYKFLQTHPAQSDVAAHWCAARSIGYRIDFASVTAAGLDPKVELSRWNDAFGRWSLASGSKYAFGYRGQANYPLTDSVVGPTINSADIPAGEIAITYAQASGADGYTHPGLAKAIGIGGITPPQWQETANISKGTIIVDVDDLLENRSPAALAAYVHELGHALGLGHTQDEAQVMFTSARGDARINAGDRAGIQALAAMPC